MLPIIDTVGLTQRFGSIVALNSLNISVPEGMTGLVGANGAGKTTLINVLLGLRVPNAGTVSVLGCDPITEGFKLRLQVGLAPERNVLPNDMRAVDFVRHLAEMRGIPRKEARTRASDALWLVGLGEERLRELGTMSTGQRQRVKLAQAVASDPKLVFLDEPTDGLDPVQRREMLDLIYKMSSEFNINVLLASHVLEEIERVCDNIVALDAGNLVACGTIDDLAAGNLVVRGAIDDLAADGTDAGGTDLAGDTEGIVLELVDIETSSDTFDSVETVEAALRESGLEVRRKGAVLNIKGSELGGMYDHVRDAVADSGARIHRLEKKRFSLDDIYANIVDE
ncbi:MAG: ABC transporter ATP-binding protein [Acidimicrobiaceae bacterium]|nr:ABC transporter ATP-binding protein [Acidimicrobiaceae bacterium]